VAYPVLYGTSLTQDADHTPKERKFLADLALKPRPSQLSGAEHWRQVLDRIPTAFGKLVFMASLWDSQTGAYYHSDLCELMGREDADRTLCLSHHQIFSQWLGFSLAEQKADLERYLDSSGGPRFALAYRNLAPPTARDVERQLYITDLETLLELLRFG
jgi:hypothetical protein